MPVNASSNGVGLTSQHAGHNPHDLQLLSFDGAPANISQDLIFGDRGLDSGVGAPSIAQPNAQEHGDNGQALSQLDFDVATTDLFNLFNMSPIPL